MHASGFPHGQWLLTTCCALVMIGCVNTPPPGQDSAFAAESARARATLERLIEADNASDLPAVVACFAEDAVLLPPAREPIRGRAAIEAHYRALFARERLVVQLNIEETALSRDDATLRGRTSGKRIPLDGTAAIPFSDGFTARLRRAADQSWRVISLEWKSAPVS